MQADNTTGGVEEGSKMGRRNTERHSKLSGDPQSFAPFVSPPPGNYNWRVSYDQKSCRKRKVEEEVTQVRQIDPRMSDHEANEGKTKDKIA